MKRHLFSLFFLSCIFICGCGAPGINPPGNQNNNQNNNTSVQEQKGMLIVETEEQVQLALRTWWGGGKYGNRYDSLEGKKVLTFDSNKEVTVPVGSYRVVGGLEGKITYLDLFYPIPTHEKFIVEIEASGQRISKKILEPIGIGRAELQGLTCSGFTSTGWNYDNASGLNYEGNVDTGELFMYGVCGLSGSTVDWKGRLNYVSQNGKDNENYAYVFGAEFSSKKVDRKTWPGKSYAYYDLNYRLEFPNKTYSDGGKGVYLNIECRCYNLKKEEE